MKLEEELFPRFDKFVKGLMYWESVDSALYKPLVEKYNNSKRYFHNLSHINNCLNEFDEIKHNLENPDEVELAIWYQNSIYNSEKRDNEERSSDFLRKSFSNIGGNRFWLRNSCDLILTTKKHLASENIDSKYLNDIDLSSLGCSFEEFLENTSKIRQEYSNFSDEEFNKGRIAFLESMLNRSRIYLTDYFYQKYENQARENMEKGIEILKA